MLLNLVERLGRLPPEVWLVPPFAFLAAILAIGLLRHRARLRRFRAIAARMNLSVKPGLVRPSTVHGAFGGRSLEMRLSSPQRETIVRKNWTRVAIDVKNPASLGLHMRPQDAVDRMMRLPDVTVGDAEFDRRFLLRSSETALVRMLFADRGLRESILRANINTVRLFGSPLEVYYAKEVSQPEQAELLFATSVRLADAIDELTNDGSPDLIATS